MPQCLRLKINFPLCVEEKEWGSYVNWAMMSTPLKYVSVVINVDLGRIKLYFQIIGWQLDKRKGWSVEGTNFDPFVVFYVYVSEKPRSVVICEHKKASITCKEGKKINIVQANYGRLNKRACTKSPIRSTNCRATKSLAIVQSTCHQKASCALHASNKVFGDPCKGIFKYLLVKYKCER